MKAGKIIVLIAALLVVLGGGALLYSKLSDKAAPQQLAESGNTVPAEASESSGEGQNSSGDAKSESKAPDFTVFDAGGGPVRLSDFIGKPVIVNFWASWCGPCRSEMPEFDSAFKEYGGSISFLMINLTYGSETREAADAFVKDNGFSFPILYDTKGDASGTYGVSAIPTTYFVNEKGELAARAVGTLDAGTLKKGIDILLSGGAQ